MSATKEDMEVLEELLAAREGILAQVGMYLRILAITRQADKFGEFTQYLRRYFSSEVMSIIEDHELRDDVSVIMDKIAEMHDINQKEEK